MYQCNEKRLEETIKIFSTFGDSGHGGITRYSLSPEAHLARAEFVKRMTAIGASLEWDDMANMYATLEGSEPGLKRIVMTSHADSVKNGGNYDGILGVLTAMKLPFPHEVVMTFVTNWKELLIAGGVTFSRAALGFSLGAIIGIVLAVVMSLSRVIEKIAFPYLIISQMIPVLGLAPIIFNIVRDMNTSRIVISAYITFFPVAANMLSGLKSVEQDKKDLLYSIAAGKVQVYKKLMFPYALPYLFSGLKIAAPMAVTASILVDMLGSSSGIGVKLLYSLYSNATDIFWASVITSAIMGILSHHLVVVIGKILLPWQSLLTKRVGDGT